MKKFFHIFIWMTVTLMTISSCQHYLDVQPQGMVLPETDEEFAALLHTHLRDIEGGGDELIFGNMKTIADLEACADNLDANLMIGTNLVSYAGEIINQRQREYRDYWVLVRDCNIVIENLQDRKSDTAVKTLSAAYALKGLAYYQMVRQYCEPWEAGKASQQLGLPLIDHFNIEARPARSDLQTTAEYTLNLYEKSLQLQPSDSLYLFTEYIIKAFQARMLFWMEDWSQCQEICQDILTHSGLELTLAADYERVINAPTACIGEVLMRSHINDSNELDWYFTYLKNYLSTRPAASALIRLYGDQPQRDVRYRISFDRRHFNRKLPEVRLRLSEILLMQAECYYHQGQEQQALELINQLRKTRIDSVPALTMETLPPLHSEKIIVDAEGQSITPLLQLIMDERRKELYMEGDRWFELKRNGCPEWWIITDGLKYTTQKYLYTAPIYKGDVDMNPEMIQNPGYTR